MTVSSYERERYVELSKVANEQAMDLGALHSAVKRVVNLWNDIEPVSLRGIGDEDQEHVNAERMAEAIGRLESEWRKQDQKLEQRELEAEREQAYRSAAAGRAIGQGG